LPLPDRLFAANAISTNKWRIRMRKHEKLDIPETHRRIGLILTPYLSIFARI
jgi:hypothetical protein